VVVKAALAKTAAQVQVMAATAIRISASVTPEVVVPELEPLLLAVLAVFQSVELVEIKRLRLVAMGQRIAVLVAVALGRHRQEMEPAATDRMAS
jgi:hypothetical protein